MRIKSRLALLAMCITTAAILLIPAFAPAQSTASVPECVPAPEICDGVDNDCDDLIDDEDPDIVGQPTWYPDDDGDSYGDLGFPIQACTAPAGYVSNSEDCHDGMASVNPAGSETCFNDIDDDCDGLTDAADPNATWYGWYADTDSDGYGDPDSTSEGGCTAPDGYIADSSDCDDAAPAIHPGATEVVADGIDQNCDTVDHCYVDADNDNYGTSATAAGTSLDCNTAAGASPVSTDCDDTLATVNPAASETCGNTLDDDCDGLVDDLDPNVITQTWYADTDGDGYGNPLSSTQACTAPTGYVASSTDCDDALASVNPGASETCGNTLDDDCNGLIDDAIGQTWYADSDGDGYGNPLSSTQACTAPEGYVPDSTDCDDTLATVNPGAPEICGNTLGARMAGSDEDCDGLIDDADPDAIGQTWYADSDGDGYGNASSSTQACTAPDGYVANSSDCDDTAATINTGATEIVADGIDQNCDTVDHCYVDADNDNYGTSATAAGTSLDCSTAAGASLVSTDCDDTAAGINPGATEVVADGIDQNCDTVDHCYVDADNDNYGTSATAAGTSLNCTTASGVGSVSGDCDDTLAAVNPAASETCGNTLDDDCDGLIDDLDPNATGQTWYFDDDGDGFGDPSSPIEACTAPAGYVGNSGDCDDERPSVNPGAAETCGNALDDDCDGLVDGADPNAPSLQWYADSDGDGYGNRSIGWEACTQPPGYVANSRDCDDTAASINPTGTEIAGDGIDQNCDGGDLCYVDNDNDNYGTSVTRPISTLNCTLVAGVAPVSGDCQDASSTINPGATEVVADGIDQNCDTGDLCFGDADNDDYGTTTTVASSDLDCADAGEAANSQDCDDTLAMVNPGVSEICANTLDDDCDGLIDDLDPNAVAQNWYADTDDDGYGNPLSSTQACTAPTGYVPDSTDCDDSLASVNPAAPETCGNNLDEDCDGLIDDLDPNALAQSWYADTDGDGYGNPSSSTQACTAPAGYVANSSDCADTAAAINPGATEVVADGVDQNCDTVDNCYADTDNDDYGVSTTLASSDLDCLDPGEAANSQDCDDTLASVNPGVSEACGNTLDDDCDGQVNELCGADCTSNAVPVVTGTLGPTNPIPLEAGGASSGMVTASFTDANGAQTHTCTMNWADGQTSAGSVSESEGSGSCSGDHTYTEAGVYPVAFTINDGCGNGTGTSEYVVVYDASAGFVTGSGWINSVPGAYMADITLSGRASFGFVSKYRKAGTVPTGDTQFQFHVADFEFDSTAYEWLVISGSTKAQFRGSGTVNGSGDYSFLLTAWDTVPDRFRIKIWDRNQGNALVYDNRLGVPPDDIASADPQEIGGGRITIRKK